MKRFFLPLLCLSLLGCPRNGLGDLLFELNYPQIEWFVPAGRQNIETFVIALPSLPTGLQDALMNEGIDAEEITAIGGFRARLLSTTGDDLREIERIELRLCPVGQTGGCDLFDLAFSVSDLTGRRQTVVDLSPGERNFRELFLMNENVRTELVFFPSRITSFPIEGRFDWSVGVFGED